MVWAAVFTPGQWLNVHPTTSSFAECQQESQMGTCCSVKLQVYCIQVMGKAISHLSVTGNNQTPKGAIHSLGCPCFFLSQCFLESHSKSKKQRVQKSTSESTAMFSQGRNSHRKAQRFLPNSSSFFVSGACSSPCAAIGCFGNLQLFTVVGDKFLQQRMMGSKQYLARYSPGTQFPTRHKPPSWLQLSGP